MTASSASMWPSSIHRHDRCPGVVTAPLPSTRSMVVVGDGLPSPPPLGSANNNPDGESSPPWSVRTVVRSLPLQSYRLSWFAIKPKQATPAGKGQTDARQLLPPIDASRSAFDASTTCHALGYGTDSNVQAAHTARSSRPSCHPIGHTIAAGLPAGNVVV